MFQSSKLARCCQATKARIGSVSAESTRLSGAGSEGAGYEQAQAGNRCQAATARQRLPGSDEAIVQPRDLLDDGHGHFAALCGDEEPARLTPTAATARRSWMSMETNVANSHPKPNQKRKLTVAMTGRPKG